MIRVTSAMNFRGQNSVLKSGDYDEIWAVVRSLNPVNQKLVDDIGATQVTSLSPSWDLFSKYRGLAGYRRNQNGKMVKSGPDNWNINTFNSDYVPQFISEIVASQEARDKLNYLYQQDRKGKKIAVFCFCTVEGEELCHRSILAGMLEGVGCEVVTDLDRDYTKYYQMFRNEMHKVKSRPQSNIPRDIPPDGSSPDSDRGKEFGE